MININWHRETDARPIYMMGSTTPIGFNNGRLRETITIELTDEDGQGTLAMHDAAQLYRLYEKLREVFHPTYMTTDALRDRLQVTETTRERTALDVEAYHAFAPERIRVAEYPGLAEGAVFTREMLRQAYDEMLGEEPIHLHATVGDLEEDNESILDFIKGS